MSTTDFRLDPCTARRILDISDLTGIHLQELLETCVSMSLEEYRIKNGVRKETENVSAKS